jgi:hypothetical protein
VAEGGISLASCRLALICAPVAMVRREAIAADAIPHNAIITSPTN